MTLKYGYLNRPGVNGIEILTYFGAQAKRAGDKPEFGHILKIVARDFSDPHLVITPFEKTVYSVISTGSDMCSEFQDGNFVILDDRSDSDASKQGIVTGAIVENVRGQPVRKLIEHLMGHFIEHELPYQNHVVPEEERSFGVPRKFIEYVLPIRPFYAGHVYALGGHWTRSMGEGLIIGFDATETKTVGSELDHFLGAKFDEWLPSSGVGGSLGEEQLFHVNDTPREAFHPAIYVSPTERNGTVDPAIDTVLRYEAIP